MEEFKEKLGLRYNTMKAALDIFKQNKGELILETGTTRMADDWGAGYSTVVFGEFLRKNGGNLITVDIEPANIEFCKQVTALYSDHIEYVVSDSLAYLKDLDRSIDLLYLDSYDYPYGELLNYFGGKEDINAAQEKLKSMTEEEIVKQHEFLIAPSQNHQLQEFLLASKNLKKGTPILLDDSDLPGGGKTRVTKKYLKDIGATCVLDEYQSLWVL